MLKRFGSVALPVTLAIMMPAFSAHRALADPRDFQLINGTRNATFTEVYVAPSSSADWEKDDLTEGILGPGESVNIPFGRFDPGSCAYDIKVVGKDGSVGELDGVDLCSTSTVTFHD